MNKVGLRESKETYMKMSVEMFEEVLRALQAERKYVARFVEHINAALALISDPGASVEIKNMFLAHIAEEEKEHLSKLDFLLGELNLPAPLKGLTVGSLKGR